MDTTLKRLLKSNSFADDSMERLKECMLYLLVFCVIATALVFKFGISDQALNYYTIPFPGLSNASRSNKNTRSSTKLIRCVAKNPLPNIESCKQNKTLANVRNEQNCKRKEILEHFYSSFITLNYRLAQINGFENRTENASVSQEGQTAVAILIPSTTKKIKCQQLMTFTLFETCLPSIIKTLERGYFYKIYIGFDAGDEYFSELNDLIVLQYLSNQHISLVKVNCQTFVAAVNTIAKAAYDECMEYFVRINDDTEFISLNWTALAINVLRNYAPPNVGVVGPTCKEGKQSILTHDMVHRSHLDIFHYYYPPVFENWWADDWITETYKPDRMIKLQSWTVKHLLQNARYLVDRSLEKQLLREVKDSKIKLHSYSAVFEKEKTLTSP